MAYTLKPGQFALFKNDKKGVENRPDYKGDGLAPDGTPVWVDAWIKEGAKGKFMSCSMKPKDTQKQATKQAPQDAPTNDDETIPF